MSIPPLLLLVTVAILLSVASAETIEKMRQGADLLLDTYHSNRTQLETNSSGLPLVVESSEQGNRVHVDVYGIFTYPFNSIVKALKVPSNWCDIVSLHPNIKACTYKQLPGEWLLTFYPGSKVYQPPEDARQVRYNFRVAGQQQEYLDIILNAGEGPYGTLNHRMRFEALPLDGGRTFVHVSYAYIDSAALRFAVKIYFATLGRGKVGFTVTGMDRNGKPDYIGGPRGALERSAVRYYLAIQSFMNTLRYPEENRFNMRSSEWFDLTAHYKKQLFDLEKKEYLTFKSSEHKNQLTLQRQILTGQN
jgi:hypothetical protein